MKKVLIEFLLRKRNQGISILNILNSTQSGSRTIRKGTRTLTGPALMIQFFISRTVQYS